MDFKVGTIISTSLLLVIVQAGDSNYCTKFSDLSKPCGCTISKDLFDPICGSDGNTYMNTCFLDCQQILDETDIRIEHSGICIRDANCICSADYKPVCGNNGATYSNECVLQCNTKKDSSIFLKHRGECDGSEKPRADRRYW